MSHKKRQLRNPPYLSPEAIMSKVIAKVTFSQTVILRTLVFALGSNGCPVFEYYWFWQLEVKMEEGRVTTIYTNDMGTCYIAASTESLFCILSI